MRKLDVAMLVVLGAVALGVVRVSSACAQSTSDAPPASSVRPPQGEILLQQLMNPVAPAPGAGSFNRDDIQHLPPPRPDTLKDKVRFTTTINDPRCLPGEDSVFDRLPGRRRR